jgi:flagellar motor switch protein FliM
MNTKYQDRAEIWIANQLKFLGSSGQVNGKLAVAIENAYREDEH